MDVQKTLKVPSQYLFCARDSKRRYGHRYECERNKFYRDFLSDFVVPADESKISQIDSLNRTWVCCCCGFPSSINIGTLFKVVLQASAGVGFYCKMFLFSCLFRKYIELQSSEKCWNLIKNFCALKQLNYSRKISKGRFFCSNCHFLFLFLQSLPNTILVSR